MPKNKPYMTAATKKERIIVKIPEEIAKKIPNDIYALFEEAIRIIDNELYFGESFLLSELWPGYYWRRLDRNIRLMFGMFFRNNARQIGVDFSEKKEDLFSNQILYYKGRIPEVDKKED